MKNFNVQFYMTFWVRKTLHRLQFFPSCLYLQVNWEKTGPSFEEKLI